MPTDARLSWATCSPPASWGAARQARPILQRLAQEEPAGGLERSHPAWDRDASREKPLKSAERGPQQGGVRHDVGAGGVLNWGLWARWRDAWSGTRNKAGEAVVRTLGWKDCQVRDYQARAGPWGAGERAQEAGRRGLPWWVGSEDGRVDLGLSSIKCSG